MKISVVITAYNSVHTIGDVLESVRWGDEVIVVDSESRDGTMELCRRYPNCRVIQNTSVYPNDKRNNGYDEVRGEWILTLDSDEIIPPALAEEIKETTRGNKAGYDGYLASGRELMFGRWLYYVQGQRHRPQRYLLFRKGYLKYECKRIHEMPLIKGRWGRLKNWFDHKPYNYTISSFLAKMNSYTDKDTARMALSEAKNKFRWRRMLFLPFKQFCIMYIKHQGFRDGPPGFLLSALNSFNIFIEYAKLWELIYVKNASGKEAEV